MISAYLSDNDRYQTFRVDSRVTGKEATSDTNVVSSTQLNTEATERNRSENINRWEWEHW